eukprot:5720326-Amphidinium_carterae.3
MVYPVTAFPVTLLQHFSVQRLAHSLRMRTVSDTVFSLGQVLPERPRVAQHPECGLGCKRIAPMG